MNKFDGKVNAERECNSKEDDIEVSSDDIVVSSIKRRNPSSLQIVHEAKVDIQLVPKSNDSRILNSPNINDLHPDWMPPSYIGLSFTLVARKEITMNGGDKYYQGDLLGSVGSIVTKNCYIFADEWER
jgi:hypothetical protein